MKSPLVFCTKNCPFLAEGGKCVKYSRGLIEDKGTKAYKKVYACFLSNFTHLLNSIKSKVSVAVEAAYQAMGMIRVIDPEGPLYKRETEELHKFFFGVLQLDDMMNQALVSGEDIEADVEQDDVSEPVEDTEETVSKIHKFPKTDNKDDNENDFLPVDN